MSGHHAIQLLHAAPAQKADNFGARLRLSGVYQVALFPVLHQCGVPLPHVYKANPQLPLLRDGCLRHRQDTASRGKKNYEQRRETEAPASARHFFSVASRRSIHS